MLGVGALASCDPMDEPRPLAGDHALGAPVPLFMRYDDVTQSTEVIKPIYEVNFGSAPLALGRASGASLGSSYFIRRKDALLHSPRTNVGPPVVLD